MTVSPLYISDTLCKKMYSSTKPLGSCRQDILWCHILWCANIKGIKPRMSQIWSCISMEAGQSYLLQAFAFLSGMEHRALECVWDSLTNSKNGKEMQVFPLHSISGLWLSWAAIAMIFTVCKDIFSLLLSPRGDTHVTALHSAGTFDSLACTLSTSTWKWPVTSD